LHGSGDVEHLDVGRNGAPERREREQYETPGEDAPPSEAVGIEPEVSTTAASATV
jgi:hypothetical protein